MPNVKRASPHVRRGWTRHEMLETTVDKGRSQGQLAGTYIADLVALHKSIALCFSCQRKFNHRSHGYRGPVKIAGIRWVYSGCDGCREPYTQCSLFLSEKHQCT